MSSQPRWSHSCRFESDPRRASWACLTATAELGTPQAVALSDLHLEHFFPGGHSYRTLLRGARQPVLTRTSVRAAVDVWLTDVLWPCSVEELPRQRIGEPCLVALGRPAAVHDEKVVDGK